MGRLLRGGRGVGANVVAMGNARLSVDLSAGFHHRERTQAGPFFDQFAEPRDICRYPCLSCFDASVTAAGFFKVVVRHAGKFQFDRFIEHAFNLGIKFVLVVFGCQKIVAFAVAYFFCDLFLTSDGVDGYGCIFKFKKLQQLWNCSDFIASFFSCQLPEDHLIVRCKRTDQMGHAAFVPAAFEGSTQTFAVDGQEFSAAGFGQ